MQILLPPFGLRNFYWLCLRKANSIRLQGSGRYSPVNGLLHIKGFHRKEKRLTSHARAGEWKEIVRLLTTEGWVPQRGPLVYQTTILKEYSGLSSLIPNTDTSTSIIQVELPAFSIIKPDVLPGLLFPGFLTGSETVALWECFGMRLRGGGFVVI